MKSITVSELEFIFDSIINRLELEGVTEILLEQDLYNLIPTEIWNELGNEKKVIGSLQEDLEALRRLIYDNDRMCNYVDFDRTASILRQISQNLNPPDEGIKPNVGSKPRCK